MQCKKREVLHLDLCKPNTSVPSWSALPGLGSPELHSGKHFTVELPKGQGFTAMYIILDRLFCGKGVSSPAAFILLHLFDEPGY